MQSLLVNIGCGAAWHPDWTNLDVRPASPHVRTWNVAEGLPFANETVDVCYASHVIEHLSQMQARTLLLESRRVLRQGGVIRLAVPDLEGIAREYLRVLAQIETGEVAVARQYEWITLELLDQLVRAESGGEMGRYLRSRARQNAEYVWSRIGSEAAPYLGREGTSLDSSDGVQGQRWRRAFTGLRELVVTALCSILLGRRGRLAIQEGLFRTSGECHRWMYDQFSLRQLLEQNGFSDVRRCAASESRIDKFDSYHLDVVNGEARKPDSLFMEAVRP